MARNSPKSTVKPDHEDKFVNILLLGETGAGKSTFINSFVNYLQYSKLSHAETAKLVCLIPAKFSVTTKDGDTQTLTFMNDSNEDREIGNSSTQGTKAYVFPLESKFIRIIDTPGINDTRGAFTKDDENFENILDYIGQFKYIHAICFLLKPDVTVLTAGFKYCLIELLSRLDRSAATNITFLFSRTRSTHYKAPDTINCIRRILEEIASTHKITIPLRFKANEQTNCFYFDNEGFKYLVARQQGINMGNKNCFQVSWNVSSQSSWALINYIMGDEKNAALPPHNVQDTISINKARQLIFDLAKPLADISDLIQDNLDVLKEHQGKIVQENQTADELKKLMYVPAIDLKETALSQPVTICAAPKCAEVYTIAGRKKYHYKQRCHNPCYLTGITKDVIGDSGLVQCAAMNGSIECKICQCRFSMHMHVYYETTTVESRVEDKTVRSQLNSNEKIIKAQYDTIRFIQKRVDEYQAEHTEISKALATFAYFLQNNSICPINDAYEGYLNCLIQRENIAFGSNKELLERYESLKKEHIEQKRLLEEAGKMAKKQRIEDITSDKIIAIWERLKKLHHTGKKIATLHQMLLDRKKGEMQHNMEYVHAKIARKPNKEEPILVPKGSTGATKKKKNKKNIDDETIGDLQKLLESGDLAKMQEIIQKSLEEKNRKDQEDMKTKAYIEKLMEAIESMGTINKTEVISGASPKHTQHAGSAGTGRGRGGNRGNFKQGRGNANQNRGNFYQNRPNRGPNPINSHTYYNHGNQGRYQPLHNMPVDNNQYQAGYNQNPGGYNQQPLSNVFYQQVPQQYNPPFNSHQGIYQQTQRGSPPLLQNPNVMSRAGNTYRQPSSLLDQVNLNINITPNAMNKHNTCNPNQEPDFRKYRDDPPPPYNKVVDGNKYTYFRGQPQQSHPSPKHQNTPFKKPSGRKHVPISSKNDREGSEGDENDNHENDQVASIAEMKRYLDEQRGKLNGERPTRPREGAEAAVRSTTVQQADTPTRNSTTEDMAAKFVSIFKDLLK